MKAQTKTTGNFTFSRPNFARYCMWHTFLCAQKFNYWSMEHYVSTTNTKPHPFGGQQITSKERKKNNF